MLRNYLLVALRSLRRQWGYATLNVTGLGVGMAVCLLIGLYVHDETQVDAFHEHSDRIVQVGVDRDWGMMASTPYPWATALREQVPGVEDAFRVAWGRALRLTPEPDGEGRPLDVLYSEPAFFDVLSFPAVEGDPARALASVDGLVLTVAAAQNFFGDEPALGRPIRLGSGQSARQLVVRAVVENPPAGSTIRFEALVPLALLEPQIRDDSGWRAFMYRTYALLAPEADGAAVRERFNEVIAPHYESDAPITTLVPLRAVYLSELHRAGGFRGQLRYLYIFGSAALLILLIAGINYVNLATAQGLRRTREVGVRKAVGGMRAQIARQFLSESVIMSGLALGLALALVAVALPHFNELFEKQLSLAGFEGVVAALALFVLALGIAAGAYPAFILSGIDPVRVLRQQVALGSGRGRLRRGLVIFQFGASSVLLLSTAVILSQVRYMQQSELGFSGEQVVMVGLTIDPSWEGAEGVRQRALAHPAVLEASVASGVPGQYHITMTYQLSEVLGEDGASEDAAPFEVRPARIDPHYGDVLDLRLAAGRMFDPEMATDASGAFVINETAARQLGWSPGEAVGQRISLSYDGEYREVIGVVADFHVASLHEEIPAVAFQQFASTSWSGAPRLIARLAPEDIRGALAHLEHALRPDLPEGPFAYAFLDDHFATLYAAEVRLGRVFSAFAALAVLIACLGLFGLAAHAAHARTREIGIRKALGASGASIVSLLSADFLKLVAVAFVVAAPLAYWMMQRWLEDFAYRVDIGAGLFVAVGLFALAAAALTVGVLGYRAALTDPVRALKTD
jgi:putative ABC transport system permease protein